MLLPQRYLDSQCLVLLERLRKTKFLFKLLVLNFEHYAMLTVLTNLFLILICIFFQFLGLLGLLVLAEIVFGIFVLVERGNIEVINSNTNTDTNNSTQFCIDEDKKVNIFNDLNCFSLSFYQIWWIFLGENRRFR